MKAFQLKLKRDYRQNKEQLKKVSCKILSVFGLEMGWRIYPDSVFVYSYLTTCFTPYCRIFHLYECGQRYAGRKQDSAWDELTAVSRDAARLYHILPSRKRA